MYTKSITKKKIEENSKVIFVCLGNICRSPAAEAVLKKISNDLDFKLEISSAGLISYHQGELPDMRMMTTAQKRGYTLKHRARKISERDFEYYDYIIGMDNENIHKLNQLCPVQYQNKIILIADYFSPEIIHESVPDPYYGGLGDFDTVITLLENACKNMLKIEKNK